ncbi:MAG: pyruvate, phosphate dikinase [Henriciella sp.]|jgi:pyruvate,orthophosphate dikinase|uniref:pyruvate, phosphate dikinase n=1 Tax=Henriciella sp. TaxID=1968823 RepID=UPI000C0D2A07|nr:pyruvate, phosphate dikinase [Henriciella sp.]MAN72694.1 pyruvate, phosphate dikinase [Henriciella sp.]MBF35069.1 pyruvate, phosphate dikinase [Hyphomonadaceae bacterium]MBK76526.1 pyruvate, phosphate dikinase [Henriciella sp.]PHR80040.1 MAG: pyruvate, phosphate dikinase [Henriciella sp.]|tara:strand:+ start:19447 stop:22137 length:2691 start_codon:yes stop_codon:yes gene_type:complete
MGDTAQQSKEKWVYSFGGGSADGNTRMKNLLGGKGANLAEMATLGLPVPPGFTITTAVCTAYYDNGETYPEGLEAEVNAALDKVEKETGKVFGDADNPLLVSVRSGARASMPGMMDTVLNLGLSEVTVQGLAKKAGERFAYDSYRRFIQMYCNVVLGLKHDTFEHILDDYKERYDYNLDTDLSADDWKEIIVQYKAAVKKQLGKPFPDDPREQLWGAITAVFGSWMNDRAILYRKLNDIPAEWGTAVNVQSMVFGNMGDTSATGVAFTRDPSTGEKTFYGEFLINAQGEDVVAGIRTPAPISRSRADALGSDEAPLEEAMPKVYEELVEVADTLEAHYRDMQDIEFTVEDNKLYMLQTRNGKRTAAAALKIAVDMAEEKLINEEEAVLRLMPGQLDQLLHPTIAPDAKRDVIVKGLPASPGAAVGKVVFDSDEAAELAEKGEDVILMRVETSPEDIHGMHAARAIVTARGGMTSHAAVVARGMGRPCVCGAGGLQIDAAKGVFRSGGREFKKGDVVTIDGAEGEVLAGAIDMVQPDLSGDFGKLMEWADRARRLKVRTNAETPADVETAKKFGAEGIGLCRTEHMFFDAERIPVVRSMILAENKKGREAALAKLLPMQRGDFAEIFRIMEDRPCTIRLLDPPLHEFLPHSEEEMAEVAKSAGVSVETLKRQADELHESNPMLGHRGCRLGITYPEIYEMQARAIFEAAVEVSKESGYKPVPEIMIPLVATKKELDILKAKVDAEAQAVFKETGVELEYLVGTMIELPRAALQAGKIAESAAFFSFGTNDLTQTTLGISRDDATRFLKAYEEQGIYEKDPFVTLDQTGVGELVQIATERGRKTRPDIKLGICGEHGGDPASVMFCDSIGLDYVSCSPYRVPIARLAAAHAALGKEQA